MIKTFSASIRKEDKWYVAQCIEVDIASQGASKDEALANLREALELHFEEPQASSLPEIRQLEVDLRAHSQFTLHKLGKIDTPWRSYYI